jgi:hypothetical protein
LRVRRLLAFVSNHLDENRAMDSPARNASTVRQRKHPHRREPPRAAPTRK